MLILKEVKFQVIKKAQFTKSSATLIINIFLEDIKLSSQSYSRRLLASFQDNTKNEHVGPKSQEHKKHETTFD
nr:hypothetical protein [Tanacetum cinerariifolium]